MERLRQSLHCSLMVTVFLIAAAGFIVFNIGEARASHSFEQMEGTVRVSDGVAQLIRAYKACRWTVFVVALVALLAYPTAMFPAKFCSQCFYASPAHSARNSARALRAGVVAAATLCVLALIAGVVGIGANVKAMGKVSEVQSRLQSGQALLDGSSATLSALQAANSNSSSTLGLLSTVLKALNGDGSANSAVASLVSSTDLNTLYEVISPMTVGSIVGALDASPQGLLKLVAFFSSKLARGATGGLTCGAGCLDGGDACICNVAQVPELSRLQNVALSDIRLALIGCCLIAIGCGLCFAVAAHCAAAMGFNEKLVYGHRYDQLLADKLALQGHMHHGGQGVQLRGKEAEASGQVPIQAYSAEP